MRRKRIRLATAERTVLLGILTPPAPPPDVVNMKASKFTLDTLVALLSRIGKPVRLAIG